MQFADMDLSTVNNWSAYLSSLIRRYEGLKLVQSPGPHTPMSSPNTHQDIGNSPHKRQ